MFTGLVQAVGTIHHISDTQLGVHLPPGQIAAPFQDIALGDSIAIDGICLTVEGLLSRGFVATVSPETLARTTLGQLSEGAPVNLESSLRVGSKIGGHFVTGHVDGRGILDAAIATVGAWELRFHVPAPSVQRYLVPKGSIAVNGISLTVADCSPSGDWFTVAVIPVTYQETNLQNLSPGQPVNLEGDILGKYVERFITGSPESRVEGGLSLDFLANHGYG
ncbi:riboflavin synthase [filamentous cyanobacterium CCP5]|nr:riboflavin synthase [filamentous cyanobacterium CCP5]